LAEYAVPTAIVLAVLAFALMQLPSLLQQTFRGAVSGQGRDKTVQVKQFGSDPRRETLRIQLADGSFLELTDYPLALADSLETVGTDGTTEQLANLLKQLAVQLNAKGETTTANQLSDLANSILNLASYQRKTSQMLDQYAGKRPPDERLMAQWNQEAAWLTGCDTRIAGCISRDQLLSAVPPAQRAWAELTFYPQSQFSSEYGGAGKEYVKVINTLTELLERPFLKDNPNLTRLVSNLTAHATGIHAYYSIGISEMRENPQATTNHVHERVYNGTQVLDAEVATHRKGGQVCQAGGGARLVNDQCPP
jgi:hypothetical protein